MSDKRYAIFFACDSGFLFTFCVALLSLKKNSPKALEKSDVFLFYQGLDEADIELINKIYPCKLVEYKFPIETDLTHRSMTRYTQLAYARYEIFNMLNEYEKVLYMDVDIMISGELDYVFENFGSKNGIAMAPDTQKGQTTVIKNFLEPISEYDMTLKCYNSGVILFCNNIKQRGELRDWCYEKTIKYMDKILCPDQAILNIMLQEFGIDVEALPDVFNCTPSNLKYFDKKAGVVVYHCAGGGVRFWNYGYNSEWEGFYKEYLSLGGTRRPYPEKPIAQTAWRKFIKLFRLYKFSLFDKAPDPSVHFGKFFKYLFGIK